MTRKLRLRSDDIAVLEAKQTNLSSLQVKYLVLVLLIVQNVATILSMKQASRQKAGDGHYALTTAIVLMVEILKVTVCTAEIFIRCEMNITLSPCICCLAYCTCLQAARDPRTLC